MMDQIGEYRIVEKLGEGGMGEVFRGLDVMLDREVAIKLLRPELSSRADILDRFRTEAKALGRLDHPSIAKVYRFALHEDRYFMVMEFVRGETLDRLIRRRGALAWQQAARYAALALNGLEHAHRLNIVHRDIKPANIMITHDDQVKLMDFGIARILESARQTRTGYLVGTLEYMSPEQVQGRDPDARADIYSVGAVLYEMLTGHLPFEKDTEYDLIKSHVEEIPVPPRTLAPNLPQTIDRLVMQALEKIPDRRFQSAAEFSRELQSLLGGTFDAARAPETRLDFRRQPTTSTSSPAAGNLKRVDGRETALLRVKEFCEAYPAVPIVLALLLAGGVAWSLFIGKPDRPAPAVAREPSAVPKPEPPPVTALEPKSEPARPAELPAEPAPGPGSVSRPQLEPLPVPEGEPPPSIRQDTVPDEQRRVAPKAKPVARSAPKPKPKARADTGASSSRPAIEREPPKPAPAKPGWVIVPGGTKRTD